MAIPHLYINRILAALAIYLQLAYQTYNWLPGLILLAIMIYALQSFHQVWMQQKTLHPSYQAYFEVVWNNFCVLVLTLFFTAIIWLVLALWAQLFSLVQVDFFDNLFFSTTFAWVVTPIIAVICLFITLQVDNLFSTLRKVILIFFQLLLPLLWVVEALYIIYLLVTSFKLQSLTITNLHSIFAILLFLLVLGIIITNAVYQDGNRILTRGYRYAAKSFLILQCLLALLSLYLFIMFIPWNVKTQWSLFIELVLLLYTFAYLIAGVFYIRDQWIKINIPLAMVFIIGVYVLSFPVSASAIKSAALLG